jgi:hypothetical protein
MALETQVAGRIRAGILVPVALQNKIVVPPLGDESPAPVLEPWQSEQYIV